MIHNQKTLQFKLTDPIYSLERPTLNCYPEELQCIVCDKKLKKNHKHTCQFCGHKACNRCAYKLRLFAQQQYDLDWTKNLALSQIQKLCKLGRCCRICDRKFFLRASFQHYSGEISFYFEETEMIEECLHEEELIFDKIISERAEIDEKLAEEEKRYSQTDEDIRIELEKAQTDYERLKAQRDTLMKKLQIRNHEVTKLKRKATEDEILKDKLSHDLKKDNIKMRE